jgi:hypothetical protein
VQNNGPSDDTITFSVSGEMAMSSLNSVSLNIPADSSKTHELTVTSEGKPHGTYNVEITAHSSDGTSFYTRELNVRVGSAVDDSGEERGDMTPFIAIVIAIIILVLIFVVLKVSKEKT